KTEHRADDQWLVFLEHFKSQTLKAKQCQPGESDHPRDCGYGENRTQQDKAKPAVFCAGQEHRQESLAWGKRHQKQQTQYRGPIRSSSRPIFLNRALFLLDRLVQVIVTMMMI